MRRFQEVQGCNLIVIATWLGLVGALTGCQQGAAPVAETSNESEYPAIEQAGSYAAANPLAENEFDPRVTPTAGEAPARAVKGRSTGAQVRPATGSQEADAEREEGLDDPQTESELAGADGPAPKPGTPEALLHQIAVLKATPPNAIRQPVKDQPGKFELVKLTPEQIAPEQLRRLHTAVDLAMQVISKTKDQPKLEQLFNNAVHYLGDARKQLALAGEPDQAQLLSEDAEALFKRDKTSFAAVQSSLKVVQLAQAQAETHGKQDPRWGTAFATQARLFAEKFPQETNLAAMNLITAGRVCEQLSLTEDALHCYTTVEERYPETPFAETTAGVLRRMRLTGQKLDEFAGSTLEGGFISIDQFVGHPVLIAFWSAHSQTFQNDLPVIEAALAKHGSRGLMVVGVNLDKDQAAVDRFVEQHAMTWQNIFFSATGSRGTQNPIARHYGVTAVPVYWLVDARGTVVAAPFEIQKLDAVLSKTPMKSAQR